MPVGWLLGALVMLHLGAALKHALIDRDGTLARMLPWGDPARNPAGFARPSRSARMA